MNTSWIQSSPKLMDLGHTQLAYWRVGRGPDLLFVHGWPLDARTWRDIVSELSQDFTCHLIDLPGAGKTVSSAQTPTGFNGMVTVLVEAFDQIEFAGPVGLVGHDSGGSFARLLAAQRPEQISGLVLGNTEIPGHHPWRLRALLVLGRSSLAPTMMRNVLSTRAGRWAMLRDCVHDTSLIESSLSPMFLQRLVDDPRALAGALAMAKTVRPEDFDAVGPAHREITAPVKLVWGAEDPWFPLQKARAMCAEFAGECTLVEVAQGKLFVHEEHPARFAREIRAHFAPRQRRDSASQIPV
ncbi:MAG: alpha/beta hydrolase [Deltaproteobacteria bacterium]|nr:alpha/beta hydrolase [Deltaproteobacteria bacterium]